MDIQTILQRVNSRLHYLENCGSDTYTRGDVVNDLQIIKSYLEAAEEDERVRKKYLPALDESFIIVQWKGGQRYLVDHYFYEFPDDETIKDYAMDCDGVTIEKFYRNLPFA